MALRSFLGADIFNHSPRLFFVPDAGDGTGAGGTGVLDDPDEVDDPPKTFTQDQVEKLIKDRLDRANKEQRKKDAESQKKLTELEEKLKAIGSNPGVGNPPDDADAKTLAGKIEVQKQQHARAIEELQQQVKKANELQLAAENRRRTVERDTEMQSALVKACCLPNAITTGLRHFIPQIIWDEDGDGGGKWMFQTSSGNTLSIEDGINAELPAYLRSPAFSSGGSGSSGGKGSAKATAQKALQAEEEKLQALQKELKTRGPTNDIMARTYRQELLVKKMKAELEKAK